MKNKQRCKGNSLAASDHWNGHLSASVLYLSVPYGSPLLQFQHDLLLHGGEACPFCRKCGLVGRVPIHRPWSPPNQNIPQHSVQSAGKWCNAQDSQRQSDSTWFGDNHRQSRKGIQYLLQCWDRDHQCFGSLKQLWHRQDDIVGKH